MRIKLGDRVVALSGKDKGKIGKVIAIDHKKDLIKVEGLFKNIKNNKPDQTHELGSKEEKERYVYASKFALVDKADKIVKVKYVIEDDKKIRVNRKSGAKI
jgi:large subunit ribosomal protein L24